MENQITNVLLRIPLPNTIDSPASAPVYMQCDQLEELLKICASCSLESNFACSFLAFFTS